MKIYLQDEGSWKLFTLETNSPELKKRSIIIGDGAKIGKTPLHIHGTKHIVSDCGNGDLKIGCEIHP